MHARMHIHTDTHIRTYTYVHTHMCTSRDEERHVNCYSGTGKGVINCAVSEPFGMFCHHVVTKCTWVTKYAGSTW